MLPAVKLHSLTTIALLFGSNLFMTAAWYGHLKHRSYPLIATILVSWLIALPEYCLQVPANRLGYEHFTGFQLKIIQEVISLIVFCGFAYLYLGEPLRMNYIVAFLFLVCAVAAAFWK